MNTDEVLDLVRSRDRSRLAGLLSKTEALERGGDLSHLTLARVGPGRGEQQVGRWEPGDGGSFRDWLAEQFAVVRASAAGATGSAGTATGDGPKVRVRAWRLGGKPGASATIVLTPPAGRSIGGAAPPSTPLAAAPRDIPAAPASPTVVVAAPQPPAPDASARLERAEARIAELERAVEAERRRADDAEQRAARAERLHERDVAARREERQLREHALRECDNTLAQVRETDRQLQQARDKAQREHTVRVAAQTELRRTRADLADARGTVRTLAARVAELTNRIARKDRTLRKRSQRIRELKEALTYESRRHAATRRKRAEAEDVASEAIEELGTAWGLR